MCVKDHCAPGKWNSEKGLCDCPDKYANKKSRDSALSVPYICHPGSEQCPQNIASGFEIQPGKDGEQKIVCTGCNTRNCFSTDKEPGMCTQSEDYRKRPLGGYCEVDSGCCSGNCQTLFGGGGYCT
jgi:hypothetical protein